MPGVGPENLHFSQAPGVTVRVLKRNRTIRVCVYMCVCKRLAHMILWVLTYLILAAAGQQAENYVSFEAKLLLFPETC